MNWKLYAAGGLVLLAGLVGFYGLMNVPHSQGNPIQRKPALTYDANKDGIPECVKVGSHLYYRNGDTSLECKLK